jgi:N-acyl-D-aspartate/D-glutamate deacylase
MAEFDLVIRNGTIVDGTGRERYVGDVAVSDGWIVQTGSVQGRGREEIDATGLLVTPGFVDIHTHYDGQSIWSDRLNPSSDHGVTTVVMGNCGIGFAPCRPGDRQDLIELMEGVEDIPGAVTSEGLTWDWETFPDYLDALDRRSRDIDVGVFVPHSPIRVYVMGERGIRREPATAEDRAGMCRLLREGIEAGALGLGTSKLAAHRSSKGELIPTYAADETELTELASELGKAGHGVFQMVTDIGYTTYEEQVPLISRIAEAAGRPLTYTHPQSSDWRRGIELLDEANRKPGIDLKAQLLPRPVGMMLGLSVSAHPFCTTATYLAMKDLPLEARVTEMRKPEVRAAILAETAGEPTNPLVGFSRRFDRLFTTGATVNYEPSFETSMAGMAAAQGRAPEEVAYDELLKDDGQGLLLLGIGNYEDCSLDWMEDMFESDNVVLGLGDGGAHYGMICDASYSTFCLSYWTRDRSHGRLTVEDMVHRLTRQPAILVGLEDRGLVAPGHRAHLNVIDYDRLALHKPTVISDLPAGGRRLNQLADGYVATIVHGKAIIRNGEVTRERPGKLVRGEQAPRSAPEIENAASPATASVA